MNTFTPLCTMLCEQVKEFFQGLHGYQSKTLSLFVMGAIRAESIVLPMVAEALLEESDAKTPSIERRLERFLSNKKIETEEVWEPFLQTVLPFFQKKPVQLVIDLTPYEENAQVVCIEIIQNSRVLPVAWKVMPGQTKWDEGLWSIIERLFKRLQPYLAKTDSPTTDTWRRPPFDSGLAITLERARSSGGRDEVLFVLLFNLVFPFL